MVPLRLKQKSKSFTPLIGAGEAHAKIVSCHAAETRFIPGPGDFSTISRLGITITGCGRDGGF